MKHVWGEEKHVQGFCEETRENRPLGRSRHRWDENIKMDLQEVGCGVIDWIEPTQDRASWPAFVNAVMNIPVLQNARNFLTG